MANSFTAVMPKILAQGLLALREQAIIPRLVNTDFSTEVAKEGDTIDVPIPSAIVAVAVTPANTAPNPGDTTPTTAQVPLDQWFEAPFQLSDKELKEIMQTDVINGQVSEAVKSLGNKVASTVYALYDEVYAQSGTPGTTPFGTDYSEATAARKLLNNGLAPMSPRHITIDPDAEEAAINLTTFADSSFAASNGVIVDGQIGRKIGFDWWMDQLVTSHVNGGGSGYLVNDPGAAAAIGDTTIPVDIGTGTLSEGTVFVFSGHAQQYVVRIALTAAGTMTFQPPLVAVPANNETVTPAGTASETYPVNLAFHRDAFALAIRPLETPGDGLGNQVMVAQDPQTGIPLRLEVSREHKRTRWSFDVLWGVKTVRAALAARIAG